MKKYVLLGLSSLILVAAIFFTGSAVKASVAKSDYIVLQQSKGVTTVTCTGKVEEVTEKNVYAEGTGTAKEIYVEVGQRVKKGDVLMCLSYQEESADSPSQKDESEKEDIQSSLPDLSNLSDEEWLAAIQTYQNQQETSSAESQPAKSAENKQIKYENVIAPADGVVTQINVEDNESVKSYKPVAVLSDTQNLQVRLSVNESQVSDLKKGQSCIITGVGFKNSTYTGEIKSIANTAKQKTGVTGQETVVEVIVSVDSPGDDIKAGFTAKCKITTAENDGLLVVPYDAVRANDDGKEYVYILSNDNTAIEQMIQTGEELEDGFEVTQGLKQGDKILLSPDRVTSNQKVLGTEKRLVASDV